MNDADDLLASLLTHPGWPILEEMAAQRQKTRVENITSLLLAGEDPNIREIDKERGERAGAAWLLRQPEAARTRQQRDRVTASA